MVEVEIYGKKFPLCLTVAAVDQVNARFGGVGNIGVILDGGTPGEKDSKKDFFKTADDISWLLGLLIQEGEENRLIRARFTGESTERRAVPSPEEIGHLLTFASVLKYRLAISQAVNESLKQEIEAAYPKNVKGGEQG